MKILFLAAHILRRSLFPLFIICMVTTVALALLVSAVAEYRYVTAARDALNKDVLEQAVFFNLPLDEESYPYLPSELSSDFSYGTIALFSYGGLVQTDNGGFFNITIMNRGAVSAITLPMESGRYLSSEAKTPEAVVPAEYAHILSLGDALPLPSGEFATVVGFVRKGMVIPSFSHWGTSVTADDLFQNATDRALVVLPENYTLGLPKLVAAVFPHEDIGAEEMRTLSELLSSYGSTMTFRELMRRTEQRIASSLREKLPLPMFLLAISTVAMVSVGALSIHRGMNEQSKYYLLGCSKMRSMGISALAMLAVFSVPMILNLLALRHAPSLLRFDPNAYLLDCMSYFALFLYWGVCLILIISLPLVLYGKFSPVEFYRKNIA